MGKQRNLQVGCFYHVYNQGIDNRDIFMDPLDSFRFTKALEYFNTTGPTKFFELFRDEHGLTPRVASARRRCTKKDKKLVSIIAFCCNDNHYHLVLKQEAPDGIARFMKKISVGYTNYFNKRYDRTGSLFGGRYKSEKIEHGADLQYVSAYVNLNNHVHDTSEQNSHVVRSSMRDYINPDTGYGFVETGEVLELFDGTREQYTDFAYETIEFITETRKRNKSFLREQLLE